MIENQQRPLFCNQLNTLYIIETSIASNAADFLEFQPISYNSYNGARDEINMEVPDPIRDFVLRQLAVSPLISYQLLTSLRKHFPGHARADLRDGLARVLNDLENEKVIEQETRKDETNRVVGGLYFIKAHRPISHGRVKLNGPTAQVIIDGRSYPKLTAAQYDVVNVLVNAGEQGLATDDLKENSRREDAVKILKRVCKKEEWKSVIHLPGSPGHRYRIF